MSSPQIIITVQPNPAGKVIVQPTPQITTTQVPSGENVYIPYAALSALDGGTF